jgi:glycosyltransferase involved in cell wall biosynthesis
MHYAHLPLFPLFFKYDIVFTSTAYSSLILKALFGIKKFKWVILDFNVLGTIGEAKTFRQKLYAWAVSKADGVICISEAARDAMRKRFPHLADRIVFMHEATDTNYFKPVGGPAREASPQNVVISVGNFGRDFDTLIEATRGLDVELKLATKLVKPEEIKKLPPHVTVKLYSHDEMLKAYAEAKIAVVGIALKDDYYDSVGTFALGEALSMGLPTIVTHTKSMESYIQDGVNGFFVPYKDVGAMRAKITELFQNNELQHRIGSEARRFAIEKLDMERFTADLAAYFKKLSNHSKP